MRKLMLVLTTLVFGAILVPVCAAKSAPDPQQPALSSLTVEELEKQGDALRGQKNYQEAVQYYKAAIKKDKKNAVLYNKMGMAKLQIGVASNPHNLRPAKSDFEKAAKLDRNYAEPLNNIGFVMYSEREYMSAVRYYKKALALKEDSASFHVNLAVAWFKLENMERASAEFARGLELDPNVLERFSQTGIAVQVTTPEERARYSFFLARMYARHGDIERCLLSLKKAKEEGYGKMNDVYKDPEFANIRLDARLAEIVPPPLPK